MTLRGYCWQEPDESARIRMSSYVIAEALLKVYKKFKLFPDGLDAENPLSQKWAMKTGHACRKLATDLQVCMLVLDWLDCLSCDMYAFAAAFDVAMLALLLLLLLLLMLLVFFMLLYLLNYSCYS